MVFLTFLLTLCFICTHFGINQFKDIFGEGRKILIFGKLALFISEELHQIKDFYYDTNDLDADSK